MPLDNDFQSYYSNNTAQHKRLLHTYSMLFMPDTLLLYIIMYLIKCFSLFLFRSIKKSCVEKKPHQNYTLESLTYF